MSNEKYYIFDGTAEPTLNEIIGVYRAAIREGKSVTDEYSGPFGGFALRKGPYVLYTGNSGKLGIGKIDDEKGEITYVELSEEEYEELDDIVRNGRRYKF